MEPFLDTQKQEILSKGLDKILIVCYNGGRKWVEILFSVPEWRRGTYYMEGLYFSIPDLRKKYARNVPIFIPSKFIK